MKIADCRLPIAVCLALAGATPALGQTDDAVRKMATDMIPAVERAAGLTFRRPPRVAVRSRAQLRAYLEIKMRTDLPPAEQRAQERVYKSFGLIHDTINTMQLQLALLEEQIAGFFDPDSGTLFIIRGGDPVILRAVISHELVHAIQDQYMRLAPIMRMRRQSDRQRAAHSVLEGQATLAGLLAMAPGMSATQLEQNWNLLRPMLRQQQQSQQGVLGTVPRIMRESLMFPYIAGAEFMMFYEGRRVRPEDQPYGEHMPTSTEQILHPSKYTTSESGLELQFARTAGDTLVYDDNFGEFELRVALQEWGVTEGDAVSAGSGWHGDRYEVRGTRGGTVILWAVAFDSQNDAAEFERAMRRVWEAGRGTTQRGNRFQIDQVRVGASYAVRLTDAPRRWSGWTRLPALSAVNARTTSR